MTSNVHIPNTSLISKLNRRFVRFEARRMRPIKLTRSIVSFSFDDCPRSVIDNALKPLEAEQWRSTVYIAAGLCGTTNHLGLHMNHDDVKAVHASGHEIGDHTFSHCDALEHSLEHVLEDIEKNQNALANIGIPPSETFAYPYGQLTGKLKRALNTRFLGARGIRSRFLTNSVDMNQIPSNRLYAGADFDTLMQQVESLKDTPGWLPIFTHDIRENPSEFGCTPSQMQTVIEAVKQSGARVLPMAEAIKQLEASHA